MSASIIVLRNQHCWGSQNEAPALPQQNPYGNGYSISTRVACTATKSAGYRIRVGKRAGDRSGHLALRGGTATILENNLPAKFTQSARVSPACADTGGLRGILLPAFRPRAQFFPAPKVAGDLLSIGFHRTLTVCQDTAREFANAFHFLTLSAGFAGLVARGDGHTIGEGKPACPNQDGTHPYRNRAKSDQ